MNCCMINMFCTTRYYCNLYTLYLICYRNFLQSSCLFLRCFLPFISFRHHSDVRHDLHTVAMLTGAATGVVSGFLSGIVRENTVQHKFDVKNDEHATVHLLYHVEFLHLPVICGGLLYSYCLVFDKLPSVRAAKQALFTGFVGGMMWTAGFVILMGNSSAYDLLRIFLFTFMMTFLFVYMTVIRAHQKPWLLSVIIFVVCLYWESGYFDSLIWDFPSSRFPIPGCMTGMIIVFVVRVHIVLDNKTRFALPIFDSKDHEVHEPDVMDISEVHFNLLLWQGITFITEQVSLALIQMTKPRLAGDYRDQPGIVFSCLTMSAFIGVMSSSFRLPLLNKVCIVIALLVLYVVLTLSAMVLHNGYFLEIVLGYTIALTTYPTANKGIR